MNAAELLSTARSRLLIKSPFYAHVAMSMTWTASRMDWIPEPQRTMGVRIVNGGEVQCIYYPPFVEKLTIKELYGVIQHEIEHIVRLHCLRVGHRNPEAWNVAADMCVNGPRRKPRVGYEETSSSEMILPFKGNLIWIPEDWPQDDASESYYDKLEKKQSGPTCPTCGRGVKGKGQKQQGKGSGKGDGKGDKEKKEGQGGGDGEHEHGEGEGGGGSGKCCPNCNQDLDNSYNYGGVSGQAVDNHSIWNQSDVSQDEARQIVKDIVDQAAQKSRGLVPGHLQEAIKALSKPVVRWRELLRQYIGRHVGNRRMTYSRRNRRRDAFGIKGTSHHAAANVVVIIDTSGSIGTKELEQFFAEIDMISSRAKVMVLQWDASFQGYKQYRRNDWKKWKAAGRGGTCMVGAVQYLIDKRLVADCQIMLTDGYTPWIDANKVKFPFITVITTPDTKGPEYGHVVRMKVNE